MSFVINNRIRRNKKTPQFIESEWRREQKSRKIAGKFPLLKTSVRLRKKRGGEREREHLSLSLSLSEMAEEEERRRTRPETAFGSSKSGQRRREENWNRRCSRTAQRSEETEKRGTPTSTNKCGKERGGRRNGRTGYRKLKLNREISSSMPHPFQLEQEYQKRKIFLFCAVIIL